MFSENLATYLNDHLAGSSAVLELLVHVASTFKDQDVSRVATELHAEVLADRLELEALMARLQIKQSVPRKASAWISEKLAQLKLHMDDWGGGSLRLLEATEAISVGIEGKRLLWLSLSKASDSALELRGCDYAQLIHRAEDQRTRVEAVRRNAAPAALVSGEQIKGA